jgi:hypothetical protein
MELKRISPSSVPRALELGERYRLLNEPEQAASICRDVLEVEPGNQKAARMLLLSLTDLFVSRRSSNQEAERVLEHLTSDYDRAYYAGIICERWGRSQLHHGVPMHLAGEWLRRAMGFYERAEQLKPADDDSALLRWNTCARLFEHEPRLALAGAKEDSLFGD